MISNCGKDEENGYTGGQAGDQTGGEWEIRSWNNRPWNCVLRHPDSNVRAKIAELSRKSAQNNLIGYDQWQRLTYWDHLKASNYDPAQITIACEADCSSGVSSIVKAVGYLLGVQARKNVNQSLTTYGMRAAFKTAGFQVLTDSKYLTSDAYLLPGDILLNDNAHVATNLDAGAKAGASGSGSVSSAKVDPATHFDKSLAGTYTVNTKSDPLMLRAGAGTGKTIIAQMPKGSKCTCYGYYSVSGGVKWPYVVYNGKEGFASSAYLKK